MGAHGMNKTHFPTQISTEMQSASQVMYFLFRSAAEQTHPTRFSTIPRPGYAVQNLDKLKILAKRADLFHSFTVQFYSKLRPPKLRPVFGENAKICHPKIFQTKAGFQM